MWVLSLLKFSPFLWETQSNCPSFFPLGHLPSLGSLPPLLQHKFYEYFMSHLGFGWQELVEWNVSESKNAGLKMESSGDGFYGYKMHCYLSKVGKGKQASWKTKVHRPGLFEEEPALKMVMICPVVGDGLSLASRRCVLVRTTFGCEVMEKHILECMRTEVQMEPTGLSGFFEKPLCSFCTDWIWASSLDFISGFGFSLTHCRWVFQVGSLTGKAWEAGHMSKVALMVRFSIC